MMLRRPNPIEDDLAALHAPAAATERHQRCEKMADELLETYSAPGPQSIALNPIAMIGFRAPTGAMDRVLDPFHYDRSPIHPTERQQRAAEKEAQRRFRALVIQELEISEVARETQAVYNAPDRMEYARIQYAYTTAVASIAHHQGNKEASFIRKFRELIAERQDAEEYDDDAEVRSIEARLNRLTAPVKFPVMPEAAYAAVETLPTPERQAELDRLDARQDPIHHRQRHRPQDPPAQDVPAVHRPIRRTNTVTTMTAVAADDGPPQDLDALLYQGRRLQEELETLKAHDAHLTAQLEHHEAELVRANDELANLPKDAGPRTKFEAKSAVIAIELNRDDLVEQRANLQPELKATPALIAANAKAVAAAKAES